MKPTWRFNPSIHDTIRNFPPPRNEYEQRVQAALQKALQDFEVGNLPSAEQDLTVVRDIIITFADDATRLPNPSDYVVCYHFLRGEIAHANKQYELAVESFSLCKNFLGFASDQFNKLHAIEVYFHLVQDANLLGYYRISIACHNFILRQEGEAWHNLILPDTNSFFARINQQAAEAAFGTGYFDAAHKYIARAGALSNDWVMHHQPKSEMAEDITSNEQALEEKKHKQIPLLPPPLPNATAAAHRQSAINWYFIYIYSHWHLARIYFWRCRLGEVPFTLDTWRAITHENRCAIAYLVQESRSRASEVEQPSEDEARFKLFLVEFLLLPCEFEPPAEWQKFVSEAEIALKEAQETVVDFLKLQESRIDLALLCDLTAIWVRQWKLATDIQEQFRRYAHLSAQDRIDFRGRLIESIIPEAKQKIYNKVRGNDSLLHMKGRYYLQVAYLRLLGLESGLYADDEERDDWIQKAKHALASALAIFKQRGAGAAFYPRIREIERLLSKYRYYGFGDVGDFEDLI
jgi:hypothetical protein